MEEWELSKENVQPLKSGRKVANLTAALQPNNVDRQQIILQRQTLEADLRAYVGDDPIAPWDNYIRWTEQTFPRGGKESNMMVLLQRCVQQFKDEAGYKNDPRYVSAWLKLATSFSNDPLEMYQFMRDQGIGFQIADFYEAWAWQLEQVGNTKKADSVYQEGIACKAVPVDRLEGLHREFQYRVARSTMEQVQEAEYDQSQPSGPQRSVLGGLKGRGKLHKVGTQRTGGAVKRGGSGGLGLQIGASQVGQQFAVFDENAAPSSHHGGAALPAPTGEWENMAPREQAHKENERSAGPWAGQKVRQPRSASIGLDEVSQYSRPSFTVHVDDTPQPITTPHKLPEMGNQVLSARKPQKQPANTLKTIQKAIVSTSSDDKTKVMYCKHLIYGGTTEMSIEEIRAIKVKAKKEEQRLAAEREALRKKQENLHEQQRLMLEKQEEFERRLEQQRLRHEEELKRFHEQQQMREQELQMKLMTIQPPQHQGSQDNTRPPPLEKGQENSRPRHHQGSQGITRPPPLQVGQEKKRPPPLQLPINNQQEDKDETGTISCTQQLHFDDTRTVNWQHLIAQTNQPTPSLANIAPSLLAQPNHPTPSLTNIAPPVSHINRPPPLPINTSIVTPNASALFNTSSNNTSQVKTPLDRSRPDSRGSSHSGRLHRFTPHQTPRGIAAPSPTVNTKEALGAIMAMLNNPLAVDEGWRPTTVEEDLSSVADNHKLDFASEFTKEDPKPPTNHPFTIARDEPKPTTNCPFPIARDEPQPPTNHPFTIARDEPKPPANHPFTIATDEPRLPTNRPFTIATDEDEYQHLDNQENHPPKDFVAPQPNARPRSGILQPSIGVPVMPLDQEQKEDVPMDQHQQEDDGMEGIEPIKPDGNEEQHHASATSYHESTIMHHSTHAAFEAAARMASTPFNPQFGSERPSFSLAMSSIKAPMNSSLHQPIPTNQPSAPTETHNKSAPFSIFPDPGPQATDMMACEPSIPADQIKQQAPNTENGSQSVVGATRVEVAGMESFDVNETTVNPPRQLSPIMETSAEDNPSSASSTNGSQAPSLAASHIQAPSLAASQIQVPSLTNSQIHAPSLGASQIQAPSLTTSQMQQQFSVTTNDSLHASLLKSAQKPDVSASLANGISTECGNISQHQVDPVQMSSFVSVRKCSSSSQGSGGESRYDSEFHFDNEDLFCSTKIHDSLAADMQQNNVQKENDLSSLMVNNQSLHKSMVSAQDISISAAAVGHQNQTLLNHSSRPPVDHHSQSILENSYRSVHESRLEEQLQNLSLHQDGAAATSQLQNQSQLNYSTTSRPNEQLSIDPWDSVLKQNLLANLDPPLAAYPEYTVIENCIPDIEPDMAVSLGNELYTVSGKVGKGAFATIYSANVLDVEDFELDSSDKEVALKVEKPACPWEFYISKQLQERTKKMSGVDVSKSLMHIDNAYLFDNGSCLITDLHTTGTLLDVVNHAGKDGLAEEIIIYFAIELLHVMEKMHASHIIHGDIKPDNILLTNMDTSDFSGVNGYPAISKGYTKYLKLIDMGRGIDMSLFPAGTTFNSRSGTSGFDCIEMQTGRPWTYQTDLYGLAGTLFCMLCGTYMKTYQEGGRWKTTAKWKRFWKADWKSILDTLLNVPSCQELPSLARIRQDLEDVFDKKYKSKFEDSMICLADLI